MLMANLCLSMQVNMSNFMAVINYNSMGLGTLFSCKELKTHDKDCIADSEINIRPLPICIDVWWQKN